MKKIAISQSNYIPWRGYFNLINYVDEFIFLDDVQYTRRDWRNRNLIKVGNDVKWLTIPLKNSGNYYNKINQMKVFNNNWGSEHLNLIKENYKKYKYFDEIYLILKKTLEKNITFLSEINQNLIIDICNYLNIKTHIANSTSIISNSYKNPTEKLLDLCIKRNSKIYVSGPSAKSYLNEILFNEKGIEIEYYDYGICQTNQITKDNSLSRLSIVDCLMNYGNNKKKFMNY